MPSPSPSFSLSSGAALFDRSCVRRNRARAACALAAGHDFLAVRALDGMVGRLADIRRDFSRILVIGGVGVERRAATLRSVRGVQEIVVADSAAAALPGAFPGVVADEDLLPFAAGTFDLVLGNMSLHGVNDLPGALLRIRTVLKPDGAFLGVLAGGETLGELRHCLALAESGIKGGASPRVFPFADRRQMGALLQRAGFALPVVDADTVTATYDDPLKLLRELRGMGEGNSLVERSRTCPGKALFAETARLYRERFADPDGRVRATFEMIHMIGWAPHAAQPQPLRPGSAEHSLAAALEAARSQVQGRSRPIRDS